MFELLISRRKLFGYEFESLAGSCQVFESLPGYMRVLSIPFFFHADCLSILLRGSVKTFFLETFYQSFGASDVESGMTIYR